MGHAVKSEGVSSRQRENRSDGEKNKGVNVTEPLRYYVLHCVAIFGCRTNRGEIRDLCPQRVPNQGDLQLHFVCLGK